MLPKHVAFIMDGNGRWAKARLLPRSAGHRAGYKRMTALARHVFACGIPYCTFYALSTENLKRPKEELGSLFSLFSEFFAKEIGAMQKEGVRLSIIGDLSLLPEDLAASARSGVERTKEGTRATLVLALGYGARQDIVAACNRAVDLGRKVDEAEFSRLLSTGGLPLPDLIIRTGREIRLSNFLLFEAAYAELLFSQKYFPDFTDEDFDRALKEYARRDRKFGTLRPQE